jgi:anti-sigma factor RsiW
MKPEHAVEKACDGYEELISAYLDDELSSVELLTLAAHLKACARCSRAMDGLMDVKTAIHRADPFWPKPEPSGRFLPGLLETLRREEFPPAPPVGAIRAAGLTLSRPFTGLAAAALVALAILTGGVTWMQGYRQARMAEMEQVKPAADSSFLVAQGATDQHIDEYLRDHARVSSHNLLLGSEGDVETANYEEP